MAAPVKYEIFVEHLATKVHDLFGSGGTIDALKAVIHTNAPNPAAHTSLSDLLQTSGTGYVSGGNTITPVGTRTGGTLSIAANDVVWTSGASDWSAASRYISLFNDTPASNPLIYSADYGAPFDLLVGETFTIDFGASALTVT